MNTEGGGEFLAFAYNYSGEGFAARRMHAARVREERANLDVMYDCVRTAALCATNGPLEFIACHGKMTWLQNCIFQRVDVKTLNASPERVLYHIPVEAADITNAATSNPGSLVVLVLRFDTHISAIRDLVTLRVLLNFASSGVNNDEERVHVVCPFAIVPSGAACYKMLHAFPPTLVGAPELPSTSRVVQVRKTMHLHCNRATDSPEHTRSVLYPKWYGQYLVCGRASEVNIWPSPHGARYMSDGERLPYSIVAAHCLLAGLVRFHCERVYIERAVRAASKRAADTGSERVALEAQRDLMKLREEAGQLVFDAVYSETVAHPTMSLRALMRETGFAALCRNVYRALTLVYVTPVTEKQLETIRKRKRIQITPEVRADPMLRNYRLLPLTRRRLIWFTDTLGYLMSYVLANETICDSENETLLCLQINGLCAYPDIPLDDNRYVRREDIVPDVRTLPAVYPIEAHRCNTQAGDADALRYYRELRRGRAEDAVLTEVMWMFTVDVGFFAHAEISAKQTLGQRKLHVWRGRVYLLWYHLTAVCSGDREASENLSDAAFSMRPGAQPWLAELFTKLVKCQNHGRTFIERRIHPVLEADRKRKLQAFSDARKLLINRFDEHDAPAINRFVRKVEYDDAGDPFGASIGFDVLEDKPEYTARNASTMLQQRSLLQCLPVGSGLFHPERPKFLRDFPLRGARVEQFKEKYGADALTVDCAINGGESSEADLITLYQLDAGASLVEALEKSTSALWDGEHVVYNRMLRRYTPLDVSAALVRAVPANRRGANGSGGDTANMGVAAKRALEEYSSMLPAAARMPKRSHREFGEAPDSDNSDGTEGYSSEEERLLNIVVTDRVNRNQSFSHAAAIDPDLDVIDAARERGALPPCLTAMENMLRSPTVASFQNPDRLELTKQYLSHHGIIDIEDIAQHVYRVESSMPNRAGKAKEHALQVRNAKEAYERTYARNIAYETGEYGVARNCCGALTCRGIASELPQKANGAKIRCPYAMYAKGAYTDEQLTQSLASASVVITDSQRRYLKSGGADVASVCAVHAVGDDQGAAFDELRASVIKYPRNRTEISLHSEILRRDSQSSSSAVVEK
jgi:hypothetical protein